MIKPAPPSIMRMKKTSENILFSPEFAYVQPVGMNILNPAQLTLRYHILQFYNRRVILKCAIIILFSF